LPPEQHPDLFSSDYFKRKVERIARDNADKQFEPWEEARERYIQEKIEPELVKYRQSDHDWFKSFSRRKGTPMHSSDLIRHLLKLNPHVIIQPQYNFESDWGLYIESMGRLRLLTGFPKGWLTEFSYALVDDRDLPTEERRGWRTVIVYCLMKGAITWRQVLKEFGEPRDGFNEERWMNITADFRYGGDGVVYRNIQNSME
jgi:hypothetical protein